MSAKISEKLRAAGTGETWGGRCDNVNELFIDDDCFGFANAEECKDHFNNISPSDEEENNSLFESISGIAPTPTIYWNFIQDING